MAVQGTDEFVRFEVRHRWTYVEMLVSSLLSLTAALVLSVEAWLLAQDPNAIFSCDVNNKISCGTVAQSWQATLLGFPNAYLGLIFESVVITIALASLSGVRFPRRFMLGAHGLYTIAIAFAYWLFLQAYFVIGSLCPWCLLVTVATTLVFTSITRVNILDRNITFGLRARGVPREVRGCLRGMPEAVSTTAGSLVARSGTSAAAASTKASMVTAIWSGLSSDNSVAAGWARMRSAISGCPSCLAKSAAVVPSSVAVNRPEPRSMSILTASA